MPTTALPSPHPAAQRFRTERPPLVNKVPVVAMGFWLIKLLSTTVGETVADYLAVDAGLGQGLTRTLMGVLLALALTAQMRARRCVPALYWLAVLLISVVGTQLTDFLTDGLGVSLFLSTGVFATLLAFTLARWHRVEGTLSIQAIDSRPREAFYWLTILLTFALGTAAGDLATEALGLGFQWGVVAFGAALCVVALAHQLGMPATLSFWVAYVLTRPLGAALGDWLSQATEYGGLGLGALWTSLTFLTAITLLVAIPSLLKKGAQP